MCRYTTGTDYYPVQNRQYSTHRVFDGAGALVEKYRYSPHGQAEVYAPAGTPRSSSAIGMTTLYTGRELDSESGLYYFRARMWSPQAGRFMQRDPLGYVNGMNLYAGYFIPENMDAFGLSESCCDGVIYDPDTQCCKNNEVEDRYRICIYALKRSSRHTTYGHAWIGWTNLHNGTSGSVGSYGDQGRNGPVLGDPNQHAYDSGKLPEAAHACQTVCGLPKIDMEKEYNVYTNNCVDFAADYYEEATGTNYDPPGGFDTSDELWDEIMGENGNQPEWPVTSGEQYWQPAP